MADPLSAGASVVGIVGAALHGAKRLYEFIDSLRNAPKDIAALSTDLQALYQVLGRLAGMQDKLSNNPALCDCLTTPLENCLDIFEEFTTLLNSFTQTTRDGTVKVRTWKNIAWAFKDKEIQLFRDTVTTYKVSLDVAVNAMTLSAITSIDERTRRIETDFKEDFRDIQARLQALDVDRVELASISGRKGSEWYGTDANFALNRFLDYTETLCDSPPRSFPGSPSLLPIETCQDLDSLGGVQKSLPEVAQYPTTLPMPMGSGPPPLPKAYNNAEPQFDLLGLLWRVTGRKNPKFDIGTIDLSCSFVVCDVTMEDCPIVYASAMFQNLTGYSRREVVGKNCRFLQAPDGFVQAGQQRNYVDNEAVSKLKKGVEAREETQQSLINYRKGGKPFLNLLTLIPVPLDGDQIRFCVGFQIDLVEHPGAIIQETEQNIKVDYRVTGMTQYVPAVSGPAHQRLVVNDPSRSEAFLKWQKQTSWQQSLQGLFDRPDAVDSENVDEAKSIKEVQEAGNSLNGHQG
ncbi:hypothetical protein CEP51_001115 [Fusarium floridanum]|uniref:PAS domain-containing protein n=1 Tax=Fusarium floridanum TaxID=1325733 RepID=A0A428SIE6_9HYPO|nr:hypothetical protein CEP51_001115 [Fusarium floridanum]